MKFAKKLQEELEQGWKDQYLDYKALKKVMKTGEGEDFCIALSSELHKVHDFMRYQQEVLQDQIPGIVSEETLTPATAKRGRLEDAEELEKCVVVVQKIKSFKHYSDLTFEAMRKIIKKFDKRFHCRFSESIGLPAMAQQLVTAEDISVRLLQPANECLRQMQRISALVQDPSFANHMRIEIERPLLQLRQYTFWLRELENGIQLLGVHISGVGEDWSTCVKNTFIEVHDLGESPLRRSRAKSWCSEVTLPADSAASDEVNSHWEAEGPCGTSTSKDSGSSSKKRVSKERRGNNQRWWTELCDLCPISGFPIARLPYPPFKLQMGKGQKFFDGQFLLLQLLSSFNFEVLGRSLTHSEMQALDVHVKKCKLSPFRITRALELVFLVGQGDLPAQQEMTELRTKASKKLGALKHIQRARLQRGDCSAAVAPGPLSRKLG